MRVMVLVKATKDSEQGIMPSLLRRSVAGAAFSLVLGSGDAILAQDAVRSIWTMPVSSLLGADPEEDADPLETLEVADDSKFAELPADRAERSQVLAFIEKALERLPARQRQAFLLRYWEELDVTAAAKIMGCSEGSVKTHCSRASHALAVMLAKQGIKL